MENKIYGYCRCSTNENNQDITRQINELMKVGVLEENIFDSGICSVCNSKKVHSRRSDGENFGLGTTIVMKK